MTAPLVLVGLEQELPIGKIIHGVKFRGINPAKVAEIRASLPEQGLLYAIIVKPANPKGLYEITDGHHRYEACKEEGWATIRSRIGSGDRIMAGMQGIVGNLARNEEKNYTLLGDWFREALQAPGWDLARVARTAGKTTDFIEHCMKRAEAIDPKLHGQFSAIIPRTLTDDFARIPRDRQEAVFEKIRKRKAAGYLSTESIRRIIKGHASYVAPKPRKEIFVCKNCGGIIDQATIDAGKTSSNVGKEGLAYSHKEPGDCHYTDTIVATYTGKIPHQQVHKILAYTKEKLQDLNVHVDHYARRLRKVWGLA